jgi:hypothetical protein
MGRRLPGRERGVIVRAAVGAHANLQPARTAIKGRAAVIQRDGEQAIRDGRRRTGERPAARRNVSVAGRVVDSESQIVKARRRTAAVIEPALVGEGGALREG